MEIKLVWSPRSLMKIEQIGDYIANDAPKRARTFVNRLIESTERLREFPLSGQITKENPAFRQLVIQGYRIIYRVQAKAVEIVTVVSPKEDSKRVVK